MHSRRARFLGAAFVVAAAAIAVASVRDAQDPEPTAPFPRKGEYAGAARCIECHGKREKELRQGHHGGVLDAGLEGCESCHGPGKAHGDDADTDPELVTHPRKLDPRSQSALCRSCHAEVDPVTFHWQAGRAPLLTPGLGCTSCHTVHAPAAPPPPTAAQEAEATNRSCADCHLPALCSLPGTVHAELARLDLPLAQGCGSCHAGALAHAQASGKRSLVASLRGAPAKEQLAACGQCHGREEKLLHAARGSHHRRDVGCTSCHAAGAVRGKTRDDAEAKCARCHPDVAAEFRLPNRHPFFEGRVACSDCHDVHGARPRLIDHALREGSCVRCHPQYRGPFVFAHQAGRRDGCVVCHLPHGSPNRRLLRQANTQQNCLSCHGDLPPFHDQTPGSVFTNCIRCHVQVHGSDHSRFLFR